MPDILVGAKIKEADFPPSVWDQDATEILNVTSSTFAPGSPVVSVTFVAPTTGRVLMFVGGAARAQAGDNRTFIAANVFLGTSASGTEVLSSSVGFTGVGFSLAATNYYYQSRCFQLGSLTPGSTYFARTTHAVTTTGATDGTCDIACREIGVIPIS